MKVGIRNEPYESAIGGSECLVAVMAEVLSTSHEVEIVLHHPTLEVSSLAAFTGTTLQGVRLRYVEPRPLGSTKTHNLWRLFKEARDWHAELSRPYDLFINVTHGIPPFCHAHLGMLMVLFPNYRRSHAWPLTDRVGDGSKRLRKRLREWYYEWEWSRRIGTYQTRLAISEYSRKWTLAFWGMDSRVLYPPVDTRFAVSPKVNRIVSVGRFSTLGHRKHHALMLRAFANLVEAQRGGWQYSCFGGLGTLPADRSYFESMQDLGATCGADVIPNVARERLVDTYEEAKVFWHAAGFGEDDLEHPGDAEHFGIATVEAMAAGCVPVVINKGGQPEIVEHGVSGFLWNTPDELAACTRRLILDDQLRARMSAAARARAALFSRERFAERFLELVDRVRVPRRGTWLARALTHSERRSIRAEDFSGQGRCDPIADAHPTAPAEEATRIRTILRE